MQEAYDFADYIADPATQVGYKILSNGGELVNYAQQQGIAPDLGVVAKMTAGAALLGEAYKGVTNTAKNVKNIFNEYTKGRQQANRQFSSIFRKKNNQFGLYRPTRVIKPRRRSFYKPTSRVQMRVSKKLGNKNLRHPFPWVWRKFPRTLSFPLKRRPKALVTPTENMFSDIGKYPPTLNLKKMKRKGGKFMKKSYDKPIKLLRKRYYK